MVLSGIYVRTLLKDVLKTAGHASISLPLMDRPVSLSHTVLCDIPAWLRLATPRHWLEESRRARKVAPPSRFREASPVTWNHLIRKSWGFNLLWGLSLRQVAKASGDIEVLVFRVISHQNLFVRQKAPDIQNQELEKRYHTMARLL